VDISGALLGSVIVRVVAGFDFYIAMTITGALYGWGNGYDGQIGAGVGTSYTPVAVSLNPSYNSALLGRTVAVLECGRSSCNAITTDNQLIGWGENQYGSVGVGTARSGVQYRVPIPTLCLKGMIHSSKKMTTKLSVGLYHSVLLVENQLYAWGFGLYGQLGDNTQSKHFMSN
jgi:alpha-tubulin suppressor-like RCC1 family protein